MDEETNTFLNEIKQNIGQIANSIPTADKPNPELEDDLGGIEWQLTQLQQKIKEFQQDDRLDHDLVDVQFITTKLGFVEVRCYDDGSVEADRVESPARRLREKMKEEGLLGILDEERPGDGETVDGAEGEA